MNSRAGNRLLKISLKEVTYYLIPPVDKLMCRGRCDIIFTSPFCAFIKINSLKISRFLNVPTPSSQIKALLIQVLVIISTMKSEFGGAKYLARIAQLL